MAGVTSFTLDKALGELGGTRNPDCLRLWQRFSKATGGSSGLNMPRRGEKGVLGERNRQTSAIWKSLTREQKRVFHPPIFYSLSGLPRPPSNNDSDDDDDADITLTPEERSQLQQLYDEMVSTSKVSSVYAKVAAGIPQGGTSLPDYNQRSLKCVKKLHNQIETESNHMDFAYYFLAASNHALTQGSSQAPGWCQEFTSHDQMSAFFEEKCNFPTVFASHVQGLSVNAVIATEIGRRTTNNSIKVSNGDKVKGDLAKQLRTLLVLTNPNTPENTIKCKTLGFPRGPDPFTLLPQKGYPVELIQLPGSTLPREILKLGFNAMNSKRSLWLNDLNAGLFTMKMVNGDSNNQNVQNEEIREQDEQIQEQDKQNETSTNEANNTGLDTDKDLEEEEEWFGLGSAD
ncbi:uncharacterized protein MELLADRAFT_95107 [Melampsora larici-populina 98AG31]|uniref:Uncharacterized protein n=1 Tax=Melampsora larici-populina (strain 98AG31 / pathotype 3-4-7) TaxID=747676 RepID=F4RCP2_MELLP|nr:uncharacterized protein MELLADRAFT_95107 [Melampsora larici-populina 98AG31]EGG10014.1 hypothetical protein MELLADRAFT_95107 [Melampsora larici-populina 98AG31]